MIALFRKLRRRLLAGNQLTKYFPDAWRGALYRAT